MIWNSCSYYMMFFLSFLAECVKMDLRGKNVTD
jgi:hypothetical protein